MHVLGAAKPRSVQRLLTAGLVAACALGLVPPSSASEPPETEAATGIVVTDDVVTTPPRNEAEVKETGDVYLWPWSKGRRGFNMVHRLTGAAKGWPELGATDLDTGKPIASVSFPAGFPGWRTGNTGRTDGAPLTAAVDEEGGRIFVAYLGSDARSADLRAVAAGQNCLRTDDHPCLGGYHSYDAVTLGWLGLMPMRIVGLDGSPVMPRPQATVYVPPLRGEADGKLLAVVEDISEGPLGFANTEGRDLELARNYLVQLDPSTRRQEWAALLPDCHGAREYQGSVYQTRPAPVAIIATAEAVWVACTVDSARAGVVVRVPLGPDGAPIAAHSVRPQTAPPPSDPPSSPEDAAAIQAFVPEGMDSFVGPANMVEVWADAPSRRFAFRVVEIKPPAEVWVVFDANERAYIGRIGTGGRGTEGNHESTAQGMAGIDTVKGRLYVYHNGEGLYAADLRRSPLAQAEVFPAAAQLRHQPGDTALRDLLSVDVRPDGVTRILIKTGPRTWRVVEDRRPAAADPLDPGFEGRTLDLDEAPGVTGVTLDGAARGYGARSILTGGAEAAMRARLFDPLGIAKSWTTSNLTSAETTAGAPFRTLRQLGAHSGDAPKIFTSHPWRDPCTDQDREVVLGFVGPQEAAVVDGAGSRGAAAPVVIDGRTAADLQAPASRCSRQDWSQVWASALFGRAPASEPAVPASAYPSSVQCLSAERGDHQAEAQSRGDAASSPFFARTECQDGEASGFAYARGGAQGLNVAEALSSFRIYRDPSRGVVARVESVARGIHLEGVGSISTVRGVAESWANGRRQPVIEADREAGYDPNCDYERSAGSCFIRHIFGVRTPMYSCGPCGDEQALIDGLQRAFGSDAKVRLRQPDPALARGAANGYIAAVVKRVEERFADLVFNTDLIPAAVPTLEIVRYANPSSLATEQGKAGRQIYQFAGVEVSSSYGIQCLLVYDGATNTCAASSGPLASLALELTDPGGKALAGGAFELRADADGDGLAGLTDQLVPKGACVTADDGIGTCRWTALEPGAYVVSQLAAPPGHEAVKEPFAVQLAPGEGRMVTFTNSSNLSLVQVRATDEAGRPLVGARFAAHADPDSDGKVAPGAQPIAQCETGDDGTCGMTVPAGSYVLAQLSAPAGLEPIEPLPFVLTAGGQTASVSVVNYPPHAPHGVPAAEATAARVGYTAPPLPPPPVLHEVPLPVAGIPMDGEPEAPAAAATLGATVARVVRAPGDALRLLARDPVQAAAFALTVLLLAAATAGVRRREQLRDLTDGAAF